MRVFYDSTIFSSQTYGGISRYFYEIISRIADLDDIGVEMFYGLAVNKYGIESIKDICAMFWGKNVPPIRKTGFIRRFIDRHAIARIISRLPDDNRIDHATYYSFSRIKGARLVFTVYDMIHEIFTDKYFALGDATIRAKELAFKNADGHICISEHTKKDLLHYCGDILKPDCKITVIGLSGGEIANIAPAEINLPAKPYFLYVGGRGGYKNFICQAKAYASDQELKDNFQIACFGGGAFSAEEQRLFHDLNIGDRVIQYCGGDDVLAALYRNAFAFVYPSLYEGFGIPPLEAMSCGCPVIASSSSSIPEVTADAAMLFDPTSEEELRDAMHKMAFDDTTRKHYVSSGYERQKLFSWDKTAQQTARFYREFF